jgi:hypothetical protein
MLRPRRFPRKTALVLAVLAAVLSAPHAGHPARAGSNARPAAVSGAASNAPARHGPTLSVRTDAAIFPAGSGGLCSVPGIGDIGGLLGFCSLGSSGLTGDLNSLCEPSVPEPEPANSGLDSMVSPPASAGPTLRTPYNEYGVAGQYWAATKLQCSDMTSLIGNNIAGMVFDIAKAIDRVTITVYQAAAGDGILVWLRNAADRLISGLGNAIYFPYLAVVVIIGALWLAWQGLIRKRGTRSIEGTVWMVVACAAAIWLIGRPAEFSGAGTAFSDGISQALNAAFARLPSPGQASCLPVGPGDPQIKPSSYNYTSGGTVVDQNANELWTVLVCKPWLDGEFGTTVYAPHGGKPTVVNRYGRQLLWAQAIAVNEKPAAALITAKQATYVGIANSLQNTDPSVFPLFQGKEWTTRLEVGFAALLAAVVAGVLVLLISVTLILLKLGFLLLLIVGPFFLLIGTHPGFGRVIALRWVEMIIGVLLKQAAIALVLSVLLYCYALIMGTSDAVLPWALKILMIALVTLAAFIYRKPFQHLFAAVGYGVIGSRDRAEADLAAAGSTLRDNSLTAATVAVPGVAAYRAARWARRNPGQAATVAAGVAAVAAGAGAGAAAAAGASAPNGGGPAEPVDGYPASDTDATAGAASADGAPTRGRLALTARARARAAAAAGPDGREAPPLALPDRHGPGGGPPAGPGSGPPAGPGPGPGSGPPAGPGSGPGSGSSAGPVRWTRSDGTAAGQAANGHAAADSSPAGGPPPARHGSSAGRGASAGTAAPAGPPGTAAAAGGRGWRTAAGTNGGSSGPWSPGTPRPGPGPWSAGPPRPVPGPEAGPPPARQPGSTGGSSGPWRDRPARPAAARRSDEPGHARQPGTAPPRRPVPPAHPLARPPHAHRWPQPGPGAARTAQAGQGEPRGDTQPLGDAAAAQTDAPAPFWLRPLRRRK